MAKSLTVVHTSNPYIYSKLNDMLIYKTINISAIEGGNVQSIFKTVDTLNKKHPNLINMNIDKNIINLKLTRDENLRIYLRRGMAKLYK